MKKRTCVLALSILLSIPAWAGDGQFQWNAFWEVHQGNRHEVGALGVPDDDFQDAFDMMTADGLELYVLDGYDVQGRAFLNGVFRKSTGKPWRARFGLTGSQYQAEYDRHVRDGKFCLRWVDSYLRGGAVRYAVVLTQQGCRPQVAYHGLPADRHQDRFEELSGDGWDPVNVSVVSVGGKRFYTAFYEKREGRFRLKSFLTRDDFEQEHRRQERAGRHLSYMNAYTHDQGTLPRFVAIWRDGGRDDEYLPNVHGPTVMAAGESRVRQGFATRFVAGYGVAHGHRFDTLWSKARVRAQVARPLKVVPRKPPR